MDKGSWRSGLWNRVTNKLAQWYNMGDDRYLPIFPCNIWNAIGRWQGRGEILEDSRPPWRNFLGSIRAVPDTWVAEGVVDHRAFSTWSKHRTSLDSNISLDKALVDSRTVGIWRCIFPVLVVCNNFFSFSYFFFLRFENNVITSYHHQFLQFLSLWRESGTTYLHSISLSIWSISSM